MKPQSEIILDLLCNHRIAHGFQTPDEYVPDGCEQCDRLRHAYEAAVKDKGESIEGET